MSVNDACEDLGQRVMVRVWQGLPRYEYRPGQARFRAWLCTVIRNEAHNFFREQKKGARSLEAAEVSQSLPLPELMKREQREWKLFLANLAWENIQPSFQENALHAFSLLSAGKTPEECAAELGVATNTIYVYKRRVGDRLQAEIRRLVEKLE